MSCLKQHFGFLLSAITFSLVSKEIFDRVYSTSEMIIDEQFHIPMGYKYCRGDFSTYDKKVTTLPGLYIISTIGLTISQNCNTYWLRAVSLACSIFNMLMYYILLTLVNTTKHQWKNVFGAINMAMIPPIYFFSFVYYTDMVSLSAVLLLISCYKQDSHWMASFFGLVSIGIRQTNVIFVGMVFILFLLKEVSKNIPSKYQQLDTYHMNTDGLKLFGRKFVEGCILALKTANLEFWLDMLGYIAVLGVFCSFVYWNGSIVVGDKTAHEATIHTPQLLYFSLFCLFFGWPHFIGEIRGFLNIVLRHRVAVFTCILICAICVHFNTQVHPYLLADNRHYVFYIWNRLYGKYFVFKYLMIPVYIFSLYVIIVKLCYSTHIVPTLVYLMCISAVLMPQKLVELRYFFIPYVYFRMHIENVTWRQLVLEFVTYIILNVVTFYVFFTKPIKWDDFSEPQRIIW